MTPKTSPLRRRQRVVSAWAVGIVAVLLAGLGIAGDASARTYVSPTDSLVTYDVPDVVVVGESIVVSGNGWVSPEGGGSTIGVLLDATYSGDPNNVLTTRNVTNPVTGTVSGDKRLHAIVQADAAGRWSATVPFPTSANSSAGVTTPAWTVGSTHQIRFLTGSLRPGDAVRTLPAEFTVVAPSTTVAPTTVAPTVPSTVPSTAAPSTAAPTTAVPSTGAPTTGAPTTGAPTTGAPTTAAPSTAAPTTTVPAPGEPAWPNVVVTSGGARAWVERDLGVGSGSLRIVGRGWTNLAGTAASTVAIKLNSGPATQYTREGSSVVSHPSASGDDTIWVLLSEQGTAHPNVRTINADGSFEITVDTPALVAGQYLTVQFQSGRFLEGDTLRSVQSDPLVVGGVAWVPPMTARRSNVLRRRRAQRCRSRPQPSSLAARCGCWERAGVTQKTAVPSSP